MLGVRSRDRQAFKLLVSRHQRPIFNFTYRFMGNRADAEDLTQETFLRIWKASGKYQPTAKFTTWLYRIATNLCINKQRANRIRTWFMLPTDPPETKSYDHGNLAYESDIQPTPEDNAIQSERSKTVLKAIYELPTNQRTAIILKVYNEMTYLEISQIMNRSVSAVDSLLIRAKQNLKKKLIDKI